MATTLLIFFNQVLFTLAAVLAGYYLKSPLNIWALICQSWMLGYLGLRVCAVLCQMKTMQSESILKSISTLSIFNIILTVGCACAFLGETMSSVDVISILLTFIALLLI